MSRSAGCCSDCLHYVFDYETPKTLVIPSIRLGCFFRFTQLLVVLYVVGYVCLVQKAYQETDSVISTVTTKVKGFTFTNTSDMDPQFWDVADYVIPPQASIAQALCGFLSLGETPEGLCGLENVPRASINIVGDTSFFVLTNMVVTPNQIQSRCPEGITDFHAGSLIWPTGRLTWNRAFVYGIQTGLCENYSTTVRTCEVISWCPLEIDTKLPEHAVLAAAENFTVLIKNSITFPKFNFHGRNILPHINSSYLKKCKFNHETDPHCPIFRLKDIVTEAGEEFQDMAVKGGVLGIIIDWSCDLDWWTKKKCHPKYSFRRLDNKNPANNVAPGFNFRFAKYFKTPEGEETRTLIKAYGIRFEVIVFGIAGKFSIVPTIVNFGAALSFLSLVPMVSDWFMLTCTRKKDLYSKHKTTYLNEDAEAESMTMSPAYGTQ